VNREPEAVGAVLRRVAGARAPDPRLAAIREVWTEAVGEQIARHARPSRIGAGGLTVRCDSATWASELGLLQGRLRAALAGRLGAAAVPSLRFEVGELPQSAEPARAPVAAIDPARAARAQALAAGIADESLRAAVAAALVRSSVTDS
jgi:hypothetical protein